MSAASTSSPSLSPSSWSSARAGVAIPAPQTKQWNLQLVPSPGDPAQNATQTKRHIWEKKVDEVAKQMSCLKQNIRTTHSLMWVSVQSLRGHNTSCSTKDPKLAELVGLRKFHVTIKKGACVLDSKKMKTLQANHVKASLKGKEPQVQDTGSQAPQANLAAVAETLTSLNVLLTSRMLSVVFASIDC